MSVSIEALRAVEPRQVAAWLRANGWTLAESASEQAAFWRKSAGEEGDYEVELPLDATRRDYTRRMGEVFDTLVVASGRPAAWVLSEVRASNVDTIRLRSTGPGVAQGRVPVELGVRLFSLTRELLLAAACSAHDPRPAYNTRKPDAAMDFLRGVTLGPPQEGSFIVTAYAPVESVGQRAIFEELEETPFSRRVTMTLARAAEAARRAAIHAGQRGEAEPFLGGAAAGISANLCDALAGFVEGEGVTGLDLQFAFASSRPVSATTPRSVLVGADLAADLRSGARLLRATAPASEVELLGAVVKLESEDTNQGGVVVVAAQVDGRPRKVLVPLSAADYTAAIRAHGDGQLLRCKGVMSAQGRRLQLDHARGVVVVELEDEGAPPRPWGDWE